MRILNLIVVIGVGLLFAGPAASQESKPWNSVASSIWKDEGTVHVAIGYSGTQPTEAEARDSAIQACRDAGGTTCKATGAWNYGCVYITTGNAENRAGWGSGDSIAQATAKCEAQNLTCKPPIGGCVE
jgi:hypothetical protein